MADREPHTAALRARTRGFPRGRRLVLAALLVVAPGCSSSGSVTVDSDGSSCVESMTTDTLARRSFAFDGTVVAVSPAVAVDLDADPDAVPSYPVAQFEVREWFAGGEGDSVSVRMQREVVPGQRLLVSGEPLTGGDALEDPIAWECGFTADYSDSTAAVWETAW